MGWMGTFVEFGWGEWGVWNRAYTGEGDPMPTAGDGGPVGSALPPLMTVLPPARLNHPSLPHHMLAHCTALTLKH